MNYFQTHLFNSETRLYVIEDFHKIYGKIKFAFFNTKKLSIIFISLAYLFVSFDKLWIRSKPSSMMEFVHIRNKFEAAIIEKLNDDRAMFRWDPYMEII